MDINCGNCKFFVPLTSTIKHGECSYPLPAAVKKSLMVSCEGTNCPVFKCKDSFAHEYDKYMNK